VAFGASWDSVHRSTGRPARGRMTVATSPGVFTRPSQ